MDADPACAKKHAGTRAGRDAGPRQRQHHGEHHGLGLEGAPGREDLPAPKTPVTLDQNGCQYVPHVMGIMVGQAYRILNSDGILHNIHTLPKINPAFNRAHAGDGQGDDARRSPSRRTIFQIKCDVHPWMSAYIGVFTHPFFSVTGTDGKFTISGLDAGTYEITAWHERLGTQTASVTVGGKRHEAPGLQVRRPRREVAFRRDSRMSDPAGVAASKPHVAHEAHHEELGFWRKYVFSTDHKVIGIQYAVTGLLFLLFGFSLMMLMRWQLAYPGARAAAHRRALRRGAHAGRDDAPRVLQRARGDARHHHGLPRRGAPRRRRIRELRAPAPDRRAGHGLPEDQHGELLVPLPRRHHDARQLFRSRRSRAIRVDLLRAALRHRRLQARRGGSSG